MTESELEDRSVDLTQFRRRIREWRANRQQKEEDAAAELAAYADLIPDFEPSQTGTEVQRVYALVDGFRTDSIVEVYDKLVRGTRSQRAGGEVSMQCPMPGHTDVHPSASMNTEKGLWHCYACDVGGSVFDLAGAAWGYKVPVDRSQFWELQKRYASVIHGIDLDAEFRSAQETDSSRATDIEHQGSSDSPASADSPTTSVSVDTAFEREVARKLHDLRVLEEARTRLQIGRQEQHRLDIDLGYTYDDLLGEPNVRARYTIDRLALFGTNTLMLGDSKTGKTEAVLELVRALVDGQSFYGEFSPRQLDGNVCYLNFEVDRATIKNRMASLGLVNSRRLRPIALRGKRFDLSNPVVFEDLAKQLRRNEIEVLIGDPWRRYFGGDDENNAVQVDRYLSLLDEVKEASGTVVDIFLTCHTSKMQARFGESARGSSALENWYDNLWVFRKEQQPDGSLHRYFRLGVGRDGDQENLMNYQRVVRDPLGRLRLERPGSAALSSEELKALKFIEDNLGCSKSDVRTGCGFDQKRSLRIINKLIDVGRVTAIIGPAGGAHRLFIA